MRSIVGIHSCEEALKVRGRDIVEFSLRQGWEQSHELKGLAQFAEKIGLSVKTVAPKKLDHLSSNHQGIAIKVKSSPQWKVSDLAMAGPQVIVILDEISDPHNLGAIMRTSWLMGAQALFITDKRSAHVTPTAAKVASGAAEHLPVIVEKNLLGFIEQLKQKEFWVYGLSGEGQQPLWGLELPEKVAWVVGSEAKGLRRPVARACDQLVAISQVNAAASYNASVAAAMALAETRRQFETP